MGSRCRHQRTQRKAIRRRRREHEALYWQRVFDAAEALSRGLVEYRETMRRLAAESAAMREYARVMRGAA